MAEHLYGVYRLLFRLSPNSRMELEIVNVNPPLPREFVFETGYPMAIASLKSKGNTAVILEGEDACAVAADLSNKSTTFMPGPLLPRTVSLE